MNAKVVMHWLKQGWLNKKKTKKVQNNKFKEIFKHGHFKETNRGKVAKAIQSSEAGKDQSGYEENYREKEDNVLLSGEVISGKCGCTTAYFQLIIYTALK